MKVAMLSTMAGRQAGGTETYERALVSALSREPARAGDEYVVFATSSHAADLLDPGTHNFQVRVLQPATRIISMAVTLPYLLRRTRFDVFHAMFVPPPAPPKRMVFTLHCMSQFDRPDLYPWHMRWRINALARVGIARADLIICVSNDVRTRVAETFGVSADRLVTIYNGIGPEFRPIADTAARREALRTRYGVEGPFVLFAGKLEARKNIVGLVRAFGMLKTEYAIPHKLVLAGRPNWASEGIDETIEALGLGAEVIRTGHLPVADLPLLYSAADVFVFPSFFEGFGIPPIEAMACGAPTIASNVAALPEVTGGAALLVDPNRTEEIAEAMYRVLTDTELRAALRRKGLERARTFSWKRVAAETLQAYRRIC